MNLKVCILLLIIISTSKITAQCDFSKIKRIGVSEGFIFVKSHEIFYKAGKNELNTYAVLLSRGVNYNIAVSDNNTKGKNMIVELLDKKENVLATNYIESENSYYSGILFQCKATGCYSLRFSFQESKTGCGIASMSIKKM